MLRLSDSTKYSLLTNQPSKLNAAANTATRPTPLLPSLIPICYLFTPLPRIPPHLSTHALRSPSPSPNSDSHPGAANPPQNIQLHASTTPQPLPSRPSDMPTLSFTFIFIMNVPLATPRSGWIGPVLVTGHRAGRFAGA